MAFPAPPFYRTLKAKPKPNVTVTAPATGRHQANTCVAPLTYTDGTGNKTLLSDRSVRVVNGWSPT